MKESYERAIHMIRLLNIELTKKQYNKLAQKFNLLCSESLEYISKKSFEEIMLENVA